MTELDRRAVEQLSEQNLKLYIDLIDPLKTGIAHAVSVKEDGVLIKIADVWGFNALTESRAVEIAKIIASEKSEIEGVFQHGNKAIEDVMKIIGSTTYNVPCYIAGLFTDKQFEIDTDLEFRRLTDEYTDFVKNTYHFFADNPDSLKYAERAIKRGIWGGFKEGNCVGFIGTHEEGTMGMLEILPKYRRHGYGRALEEHLANEIMKQGRYPFCHVLENNTASLALQRDMGFWLSEDDRVYWLD